MGDLRANLRIFLSQVNVKNGQTDRQTVVLRNVASHRGPHNKPAAAADDDDNDDVGC